MATFSLKNSGDLKKLRQRLGSIKGLALSTINSDLSLVPAGGASEGAIDRALPDISKDVFNKYRQGRDVYGKPWKKRKHSYNHPILNKTGRLMSSYKVESSTGALKFLNTAPYSGYVHRGTRHNHARPLVPTNARGVPTSWKKYIRLSIRNAIINRLKSR